MSKPPQETFGFSGTPERGTSVKIRVRRILFFYYNGGSKPPPYIVAVGISILAALQKQNPHYADLRKTILLLNKFCNIL